MLKDKLQHAFKELYLVYERKWAIEKEIDSLKMESIEKNAIHKVGDIVEVYDEYGKYIADGIVERIATSLFVDAMDTKAFIEKPDKCLNDIEKIRYEILAQNRNGNKSKNHLLGNQHFFYDIKDKENFSRYIKAK